MAGRTASDRQTRIWAALTAVAVVIAVAGAMIGVKLATNAGSAPATRLSGTPAEGVSGAVARVPAATLDAVGPGTISTVPRSISGAALSAGGKPRVLYVGAESCPYCATERWPVAVALARFGTFSGLGRTSSSPEEAYPNTASLSFHGAGYASAYVSFTGVEESSNRRVGASYAPLDRLQPSDRSVMNRVDPDSNIPFVDLGGRYLITGASFDPAVLAGKSQDQIAAALADPGSAVAKAVDGTANVITAAICASTGGKPAGVCGSAGVHSAAAVLDRR